MVCKPWVECMWELPAYIPGAQPKSIAKNSESEPLLSLQKSNEKQKKTYIKIRLLISARTLSNSEQRPWIVMKSIMVMMMIMRNVNTQNEFQFGLILFLKLDLMAVFYQLFHHSNTLTPPERAQNRWIQGGLHHGIWEAQLCSQVRPGFPFWLLPSHLVSLSISSVWVCHSAVNWNQRPRTTKYLGTKAR